MKRIREKDGVNPGQKTRLVEQDGEFFFLSYIPAAFDTGGPETLVFPADADGNVTDWGDIAGGRDMSLDDAEQDLARVLKSEKRQKLSPAFDGGLLDGFGGLFEEE